jgi:hypothetical protein
LNELNREEETGQRRFSGGSEGGMTALRFGSSHGTTVRLEGRRYRWKPEVGDNTLVGHTGLKGRAERAGFGGSEAETKVGRVTKWAESQGGCSINSFSFF